MAVSKEFYHDIFCGADYPELDRLLKRAEIAIEKLILRSPEGELEERNYSFAVCAQAEYMGLCGGVEAWAASVSGNLSSVSIGSVSMSYGGSSSGAGAKLSALGICSRTEAYLDKGGLLYRGCAVW